MLKDPEPLPFFPINNSLEGLGVVLLCQLHILGPDDLLAKTGLCTKHGVERQPGRFVIIQSSVKRFKVWMKNQKVLLSWSAYTLSMLQR